MLNEVDAVYVVSPPKQHYQDIKTALEYKKHILCESPITVSKSECTELFSLAKKNGCIIYVIYFPSNKFNSIIRNSFDVLRSIAILL